MKEGIRSLKEVDALVSTFTSQLAGGKVRTITYKRVVFGIHPTLFIKLCYNLYICTK